MRVRLPYIAAAAVVVVAGAVLVYSQTRPQTPPADTTSTAPRVAAAPQLPAGTSPVSVLQLAFRDVAKRILPVVVEINVTQLTRQQMPQFDFPFFPFGGQPPGGGPRTFRQSALGSGIVVQRAGNRYYVLTNNHVITNASDISVRLNDQRVLKAKVVGADPRKDIALITFDSATPIPVASLGDSNTLQVGDIVFAVGNPFGYESTVTMGIVSALGRRGPGDATSYTDYIQTDASINEGNSGGALVNIDGQVIGINTWIAAPTGGSIGLGFAIPVNNARPAIDQFISKGRVEYGWLGVQITNIQDTGTYPGFAADLKVQGVKGALVLCIYKGSPADKAGLLPGDYVTRVDNADIQGSDNLTQVVGGLAAGKTYTFSLVRYGARMSLPVKIGLRDDQDKVAQDRNLWPGMTVIDLDDQVRQEANIARNATGVAVGYIASQDTPAAVAGLQIGDLITGINGKPVRNMMDYYKALNDPAHREVTFNITREGTQISVGIGR
jgi:Do/DeqQ family serine protease